MTVELTPPSTATLVFAISGAAAGLKRRLDAFGIAVLPFVAGNADDLRSALAQSWVTDGHAKNPSHIFGGT